MPYSKTIRTIKYTLIKTHLALDSWFQKPAQALIYQPSDKGWTIQEILEHITLTNHYLLIIIRKGRDKALKRMHAGVKAEEGESDLQRLSPIGQLGSFKWHRPDHRGRFVLCCIPTNTKFLHPCYLPHLIVPLLSLSFFKLHFRK